MSGDLPQNAVIVDTDGVLIRYDQNARNWGRFDSFLHWTFKTYTPPSSEGIVYLVGTQGNFNTWDTRRGIVTNNAVEWTLDWMAIQPGTDVIWCVGTQGNVGTMIPGGMEDFGNWGGWTLKMLAFDPGGGLWGVGTDGNLGAWHFDERRWEDATASLGGWALKMVAFDDDGAMWCVGTEGNIGKHESGGWTDMGCVNGWKANAIIFSKCVPAHLDV